MESPPLRSSSPQADAPAQKGGAEEKKKEEEEEPPRSFELIRFVGPGGDDPAQDPAAKTEAPFLQGEGAREEEPGDEGVDAATLPLRKEGEGPEEDSKKKPPMYLFPITRMKMAWTSSSSIPEFIVRVVFIIFSTLGWLFCIGGVPFVSIAMLVVGAVYKNDCNIQPKIPIYLIVGGTFGTVQHVLALYTKYIPEDSAGGAGRLRRHCKSLDGTVNLFNMIWFVLGCIWVYGVYSEVDFRDTFKDEYCHRGLYLFAFWMLNISFIMLALLVTCCLGCILCIVVALPKDRDAEKTAV